jgi:hypothetical protein
MELESGDAGAFGIETTGTSVEDEAMAALYYIDNLLAWYDAKHPKNSGK